MFWNEKRGGGGGEGWKEDEKASWTSVFSLMLIIYVVCAFYYYYLFIYYFLFSSLPVFQRHHGQGSRIKLLSLVSKGFLPVYLYIYSSLHLSCCYLVRQTHEALMRSKPDMYSWPLGYLNKFLNIAYKALFVTFSLINRTKNIQVHALVSPPRLNGK